MPNYIVLRLVPPAAVAETTFTNYLTNLTINVYDVSYADADTVGPPTKPEIGSAQFLPPALPPYNPATGIVQHNLAGVLQSVATAVVEYTGPPSGAEYIAPDLRIEFIRGATSVFDPQFYYDVQLYTQAIPLTPGFYQGVLDSNVSAYVTLSAPINPAAASLTMPTGGIPPNFNDLLNAVTSVLSQDPATPVTPAEIAGLSPTQCANIASEIMYGPQLPLPSPPETLENMYTNPPNSGTYTDSNEQNRLMFEGKLAGYYAPNNATALQLTSYIFSLSTAVYCSLQSASATQALIDFPVNPNVPAPPLVSQSDSSVIFQVTAGALVVNAAYFYALSYQNSPPIKDQAYQAAIVAEPQQNLNQITAALNAGWITAPLTMNAAQAARMLQALYVPSPTTLQPWLATVPGSAQTIFNDWSSFAGTDVTTFWSNEAAGAPTASAFIDLVLWALTQGYFINPPGKFLANEIRLNFPVPLPNATNLADATATQWQTLLQALPAALGGVAPPEDVLPPFTAPGTFAVRINNFIQFIQQFFQFAADAAPVFAPVTLGAPPRYPVPGAACDVIAKTIAAYPGFAFGNPIVLATLEAAAAIAVPGDPEAQAWAVQAVWTINELFILASLPQPPSFNFSVMEALYARGFTSREEVIDLPLDDFQQALTGTIAYAFAVPIYANAGPTIPFPPPPPPGFHPINPCCLTDCIPPLYLSPLGPVAYLHEMLKVSERSTCDHPFAPPAAGHTTLQAHIDARRGPIETLAVTSANLETPLPLIDLVNECLEFMASTSPITQHGTVYNTAEDALAGHKLCATDCCEADHQKHHCHNPVLLFDALPEYSTPATPVPANSAVVPAVWDKLRADFSTCCLPYNQPLDVSRTYLEHFRTCRYEEMRTFRKCITEFVLDPVHQPAQFQTYLWRYPVRIDIAIEYLGISREEYTTLFHGLWPRPCAPHHDDQRGPNEKLPPWQLYGFASERLNHKLWTEIVVRLPEFLKRTCLSYCEFLELWKCAAVKFRNGDDRDGSFPDCEPCCLEKLWLEFPGGHTGAALWELEVFIRLWRKLQRVCGADYTFCQLADICSVLHFPGPDFIRQLAAFQMLRDQFRLALSDGKPAAGATGADRAWLLSLWVGPAAKHWHWAVEHLIVGIAHHAECHHKCKRRGPEFLKLLSTNFDPLSRLAGFDPATVTDTWRAAPTHTLRFAEILAKIYASDFSIGEVLFLFTADPHLDGEDPFPLQDENEAEDSPLGLPAEEQQHSLWELRRKLLHVHVPEEDAHQWSWPRIESVLTHEFGFAAADLQLFGEQFFPLILEKEGQPVNPQARRFLGNLPLTTPPMWNTPPPGPFRYDAIAGKLWAVLPLPDEAVLAQLIRIQALNAAEQQAVQDVYFGPRKALSRFAMVFSNFAEAERRLIEEEDQERRWSYFQRQFALCHVRSRVLADHLSAHVDAATRQRQPEGTEAALLLLKHLYADENFTAANWENDNGQVPPVTWTPPPNGGAFAALLGLAGTGLEAEFKVAGKAAWREVRGPMRAFGDERDRANAPVPTVIPSMGLTLTPQQMQSVMLRNGFAMQDSTGRWLGGAEGFTVTWHGALLVDDEGEYRFCAGAAAPGHEEPRLEEARNRSWKVTLQRGQKTWVLLRHHWHGESDLRRCESLHLRRGAYTITVELVQHAPAYLHSGGEADPQHTGFEIKYSGPDTHHELVIIPHDRLLRILKEHTLEVPGIAGSAADFLSQLYTSSLRDARRTYQRAFKAMLFSHRFALSAKPRAGEGSELGYMLARKDRFAGSSCYRNAGVFTIHLADFDFNFLPVADDFHTPIKDARAHPSLKRKQAMFDWWERIFDYHRVRQQVQLECERRVWLLFAEAFEKHPADPDSLLRHMCADARHWPLDLHFFQDQTSPIYAVTSSDLEDDRWMVRAWHADRWLCRLWRRFTVKDMTKARPDLWASDDPSALVPGQAQTGNANLLQFLCDGCIENGDPRRYEDLKRLNDGLRERGREALISYLCGPHGIVHTARELSAILLLDVRAGLREKASRIEEAISAVQIFIQRSRLGLEPGWIITRSFAEMWDFRFATYHVWQACKRRELYKENWIDWHELEKAKSIEAFNFLDEELKRVTLTIARPGGVTYWPDHRPPVHPGLCLLQDRDPAEMQLLPAAREGLDLLATPERSARPSWITMVPECVSRNIAPGAPPLKLPFWIECAIRLGTRFIRLAAAAYPPASTEFVPRHTCHDEYAPNPKDGKHEKRECCVSCCRECGCEHPAHIDEYWFWLIDAKYFDPQTQPVYSGNFDGQQSEYYDATTQVATPWHDVTQLPAMLEWPPQPMVRLAWCRVHNGEFQQPRRSVWGVPVNAGVTADISFEGRVGDSLYFDVTGSVTGTAGFRYDMVPDIALESGDLVVPAAPPPPPPPGGLVAYPYFAYFVPGDRLFPWSLYSPAVAVAHALRAHCRFEAALKWYNLVYNPFDRDNRWAKCEEKESRPNQPPPDTQVPGAVQGPPPREHDHSCCCDTTKITCHEARDRSILLHYLECLLEWVDAVMRINSPEAFQRADLLLDTMRKIMGPHPHKVKNPTKVTETVATFEPLPAPVNPRLMMLYDRLDDRFALIHDNLSARRLREAGERHDAQYWGDDPVRDGWRSHLSLCCDADDWCHRRSPYRFTFLIQKAKELAAAVRELGGELLPAFEKGDAGYLESVHTRQEREVALLGRKVNEDQWRDADWQVQALEKTKAADQSNLSYYLNLIATFPIADETAYVSNLNSAITAHGVAIGFQTGAEFAELIPDIFVGTVDFLELAVGTKIAGMLNFLAKIADEGAEIASINASLDLTQAGWIRRLAEWQQQVQILKIQIEETELRILGAERQRHKALRELDIQQRRIEQATEVLDIMRDKFTNHALYLFLQKQIADLYYQMYELALHTARQAEHAFHFERGDTARKFIGCEHWDNLHEGLLAGERLQLDLARMEKEYCDLNRREYELTKHISLRIQFPWEFLRLKITGQCEIEIPEWLFDVDYPGQYMRRIKNLSLTIPAVSGPFNEVHCRLTLLRSATRIDPLLSPPAALCCHCKRNGNGYRACPHDPRVVRQYGATEAIATSTGQNDAGLFELSLQDDRYLPFEFHGAVSLWRIELPHENNYFPMDTLSDLILHHRYTSREGGEALRRAAREAAERELPGDGWCFFDLRHDFADAWELFRPDHRDHRGEHHDEKHELLLRLGRNMFPFVPGARELCIEEMALLFNRCQHCGCECPQECPCCMDPTPASYEIVLQRSHEKQKPFRCLLSNHWPGLYHGVIESRVGPLPSYGERTEVRFCFPQDMGCVDRAYLLCRYSLEDKCPRRKEVPPLRCNPCDSV